MPLVQVTFVFLFRKEEFQVKQSLLIQSRELIPKNGKRKDFIPKKKPAETGLVFLDELVPFLQGFCFPIRGIARVEFFEELQIFFIQRQFFEEVGAIAFR